jgi:uncharacterized Fe-S cluster-containing protein
MDEFTQLQSLMMGYDRCALYWNKELRKWALITDDEEQTATLVDERLDRLIELLLNSDL